MLMHLAELMKSAKVSISFVLFVVVVVAVLIY